jgi:5'-3' exonuclease
MDKVLILDGLHLINRANVQFGPPKKQTPSWEAPKDNVEPKLNNSIVYTAFRMLRAVVEQFNATKVFCCLEGKNNFRYGLFPEYKANRLIKQGSADTEPDEKTAKKLAAKADFERQRDIFIGLLKHLPIQIVNADAYEADDVIATLVSNMPDEDIVVLSSDSDLIQLLQTGHKGVRLYDPRKKQYVKAPEWHYLCAKCLRGDTSDNIPSIAGPQKTEKLLANPKLLEDFLSSAETKASFNLNKELIELRIIPDEQLIFADYNVDYDALKEEFRALELPSMIEDGYWTRFVETFSTLE